VHPCHCLEVSLHGYMINNDYNWHMQLQRREHREALEDLAIQSQSNPIPSILTHIMVDTICILVFPDGYFLWTSPGFAFPTTVSYAPAAAEANSPTRPKLSTCFWSPRDVEVQRSCHPLPLSCHSLSSCHPIHPYSSFSPRGRSLLISVFFETFRCDI